MVDPKRAQLLIRQHFEELTTEQFILNLQKHCPEVFSEQEHSPQHKLPSTNLKKTKS